MIKLKLSIVTPVYNEEEVIRFFHARTVKILNSLEDVDSNILFVVDKCTDNTLNILRTIVAEDPSSRIILMSSRFGHQMSLLAGIENSLDSDAIIMMDSDLQHPPELIPALLSNFRMGFDIVYTERIDTEELGLVRKLAGKLFYKILGKLSQIQINENSADFRLISNRVAKILVSGFHERNMFLRGLFSWIGFPQTSIEFVAARRFAGKTKYSFTKMMQLAITSILSFSTKPLKLGIFIGISFACIALVYLVYVIIIFFIHKSTPSGWTSLAATLLLLSGVQLIVLGIMGTYIGAIYEEVKKRPHYIIEEKIPNH